MEYQQSAVCGLKPTSAVSFYKYFLCFVYFLRNKKTLFVISNNLPIRMHKCFVRLLVLVVVLHNSHTQVLYETISASCQLLPTVLLRQKKHYSERFIFFGAIILYPKTILITHGYFQYTFVSINKLININYCNLLVLADC